MSLFQKILSAMLIAVVVASASAQQNSLGTGPWYYDTFSPSAKIKVSVMTRGINHPWGMAFLPDGDILVAERGGQLRIIRDGELDPNPVNGMPEVAEAASGGLMDLVLHPDFENNRWVYFTYVKGGELPAGENYYATTVMARGRLNEDATTLLEVEDIFVTNAWGSTRGGHGSRLRFAPDGTVFFSSPFRRDRQNPQNTLSHISKLLRLNDDGSVPTDNPFVGQDDYLPEIYSIGHRTIEGIVFHPVTGDLWASEHGPQGGDEVNIIHEGANYGWPLVSYGRDYDGGRVSEDPWLANLVQPEIFWVPSIATSGMMFYSGDEFPQWQNDLFVGGLMTARVGGTGHVERIEFNENGEVKREWLLEDLHQRIRDVQQGPDGLIYILTEAEDGALLVMEAIE